MLLFFTLCIIAASLIALQNWRRGILAAILIGLLQDPIRKMIPGTPGLLAMASVPVWLAVVGGAFYAGSIHLPLFLKKFPRLGRSLAIFAAYLLIPSAISASYGAGTWMITMLGLMIYGTIFMAMNCGWTYPSHEKDLVHLLGAYALMTAVMLTGGPLEYLGWSKQFAAIGTEALGHIWVTHRTGSAVYMLAGFFRSPDVMGWHAALVVMVSFTLAMHSKSKWRWFWLGLAIWGAGNVWLCGRRKMVSMLPVFLGLYLLLIYRFRDARRFVPAAAAILLAGGLGWFIINSFFASEAVETFYLSAFTEVEDQMRRHAVLGVFSTLQQAGFWGYGMGMAQQGIHHIDAQKPHLWQESGPTKLMVELGVPGFFLVLLVAFHLAMTTWYVLRANSRENAFYINAGLISILVANVMSALVSAQIYGDPLIANVLALMTGLALSSVRMRKPAPNPQNTPTPEPESVSVFETPQPAAGT